MTTLIFVVALVITLAAAVRSTWSPCGRSMLSTITPLAERGRGHRFAATAAWFVAGAVLGGLCLGALGAGAAAAVAAVQPGRGVLVWVAAAAVIAGAACDAGLGGLRLPAHHRQVNEWWLDRFRAGVYGMGFGWQIGTGLATYVMTAGVYLVVVLGGLTGRPWLALALGAAFGAVRGLAVLCGRSIRSPAGLAAFHRRFDALDGASRRAAVAVEAAGAVVLAGVAWPPAALVVGAVAAATLIVGGPVGTRAAPDRPREPVVGADRR
jgi:hypothetical protein